MKTLYKDSLYRCIHSPEEEAICLADGWQLAPEEGKLYIVHTAVAPPTDDQAAAADLAVLRRMASAAPPPIAMPLVAGNAPKVPAQPEPAPDKEPADVRPVAAAAPSTVAAAAKRPALKLRPSVASGAPQGE